MKDVNKYTEFAERFLSEMGKKGCTATEIAALLGITKQSVSNYTSGKSIPPIDKLHKLADYFDVTLDWLLCRPGAVRAANADIDFVCRYTGLSEKNITDLHKHIAAKSDDPLSKHMTPPDEWIPALQKYIEYSVGNAFDTPVDYVSDYMWYAKACVELGENGDTEKVSQLSEEDALNRWRKVREYLRDMELAEYQISKSFGKNSKFFWADIYRTLKNGQKIKVRPDWSLHRLADQYNKKSSEQEVENSNGEYNGTDK